MTDTWGNDPVQAAQNWGADPIQGSKPLLPPHVQQAKSLGEKLHDIVFVPRGQEDKTPGFGTALDAITGIPEEIGKEAKAGAEKVVQDFAPKSVDELKSQFQRAAANPFGLGGAVLGDIAGVALSPLTGTATSVAGRPIEAQTGIKREIPGNILSMVIPGLGAAKSAKASEVASATSKMSKADDYEAAVNALKKEGVELTPGQAKGGQWRRAEEAHKSNPFVGGAIRDAENKSIMSFNKAAYNRALAPIGEKHASELVGRDGLKLVGNKLSAEYEKLKPQMKLVPDDDFINDLAELRGSGWRMPAAQEAQLESYINNRVLKRIGPDGGIDGNTFKQIESELTHLAGTYKSSADAAQRELGNALEELNGSLRDNLQRTSDPAITERLKKLNTSWAILRRVEGAAANRSTSGGVFTTGDLLASVKRADKTAGKRAFARGDALLQDFAETANTVLPNRVPDSGTPERLMFNDPKGLTMWAAGRPTNYAATKILDRMAGRSPRGAPLLLPGMSATSAQNVANQLELQDAASP